MDSFSANGFRGEMSDRGVIPILQEPDPLFQALDVFPLVATVLGLKQEADHQPDGKDGQHDFPRKGQFRRSSVSHWS
jgi:hypothetical protein